MSKLALPLLALFFIFQVVACGAGNHTLNLTKFSMPRDQQLLRIDAHSQDDSLATFVQQYQKKDSATLSFNDVASQVRSRFVVRDFSMVSVVPKTTTTSNRTHSQPQRNNVSRSTTPVVQSSLRSIQLDAEAGTLTINEAQGKTSFFKGDIKSESTVKTLAEVNGTRTAKLACVDSACALQVILIKTMSQSKLIDIKAYLYMKIAGEVKNSGIDGETNPIIDPKAVNSINLAYDANCSVGADSTVLILNVNTALVGGSSKVPAMAFVSDLFNGKRFQNSDSNSTQVNMHYNKKISATFDVVSQDDSKYLSFSLPQNKTLDVLIQNSFKLF